MLSEISMDRSRSSYDSKSTAVYSRVNSVSRKLQAFDTSLLSGENSAFLSFRK